MRRVQATALAAREFLARMEEAESAVVGARISAQHHLCLPEHLTDGVALSLVELVPKLAHLP